MSDPTLYRLLSLLEEQPHWTQRELAKFMGVSLGKVNSCLRALIDGGLIQVKRIKNSPNKSSSLYILTPFGVKEKAKMAKRFLESKLMEYEVVRQEIEELRADVEKAASCNCSFLFPTLLVRTRVFFY